MFPNKVISISESIIWKLPDILEILEKQSCSVEELWEQVSTRIEDVDLFIICLDILFVLNEINFDEKYAEIKKC
jgi:hypothetical protein